MLPRTNSKWYEDLDYMLGEPVASYQIAYESLTEKSVSEVATLTGFNWRENVKRYTGEDPLICPKCGNEMELFQLTYPDGYGKQRTVGGYDWLIKRGVLTDVLEEEAQVSEEGSQLYLS